MAEALLWHLTAGAVVTASAGATPAVTVDPMTFDVLDTLGIDWRRRRPKGFDAVIDSEWDLVVTVCDHAREACPVLPGHPVFEHWPMEDPSDATGSPDECMRAFLHVVREIAERMEGVLAAPELAPYRAPDRSLYFPLG